MYWNSYNNFKWLFTIYNENLYYKLLAYEGNKPTESSVISENFSLIHRIEKII